MVDYSEMTFTTEFLEHAARTPSQYDATCRGLASEVIRLRARVTTARAEGRATGLAEAQARYAAPVTDEEVRRLWVYAFDVTREPTVDELQAVRDAVTRLVEIRTLPPIAEPGRTDVR